MTRYVQDPAFLKLQSSAWVKTRASVWAGLFWGCFYFFEVPYAEERHRPLLGTDIRQIEELLRWEFSR